MTALSRELFANAQRYMPGGVNSPVRAFRSVGGEPIFINSGYGAYLVDADGRKYIDYICSWGPLIAGHAHPEIVKKVSQALHNGLSFGAPTAIEVQLAEKICGIMPNIEMIRFVSSGTEAAMSAIRLARGFTKRDKIIKFAGCYHGHADSLLVSAGSGALTLGVPSSAGVPQSIAEHTLVADYNNLEQVTSLFETYPEEIAAIIVEPVAGNMNCVLPKPDFLSGLRRLCDQHAALLIFDEVITGFRVGLGGAQAHYNIKPDLTVLGKVIGGGMPVGAFGGRAEVMQCIAPLGSVYQAGTLSGNPIAMTAGLATLELIMQPNFYVSLAQQTKILIDGLAKHAHTYHIPFRTHTIGSMFGLFFTDVAELHNEKDVQKTNIALFKKFFHAMLKEGIYFAPSAFEVGFVSSAHEEHEISLTLAAAEKVFGNLAKDLACTELLQVAQA